MPLKLYSINVDRDTTHRMESILCVGHLLLGMRSALGYADILRDVLLEKNNFPPFLQVLIENSSLPRGGASHQLPFLSA